MEDFIFHNPTRIVFGRDQEQRLGEEIKAGGVRSVLLVFGRSSAEKSGLLDRIKTSLEKNEIRFEEFGGVVPNPVLSHVREGILAARKNRVEAILAVGGGSVLDEAKAIAAGAVTETDIWEFFTGREITGALPVFSVLTLAATGSEMNGNSVITNEVTKEKFSASSIHLYPRVSILNPTLTFSVSREYTAYAAVDAIAHLIEGYFTGTGGSGLQDRLVESIIKSIIESTERILVRTDDYAARAEFEWAATLALNGLTIAGLRGYGFPNHLIEHSLSAIYDLPHGAGLAIVIPAWSKWYAAKKPEKFERFAREIFGKQGAEAGIVALENWFRSIGAPVRLEEAGIQADEIEAIAANALRLSQLWQMQEEYSLKTIAEILRLAV